MKKVLVFSYRYIWKIKGSSNLNFKIVTDTLEGLLDFEKKLLSLEDIESAGKEYLHEYDCSKIGVFTSLKELVSDEKKEGV